MNLDKLFLLLMLYAGGAILALVILAVGWRAARGRGAVVALAIAAAICLVLQAIVLLALSDMGRGWGGNAIDLPIAIGGIATLAGFLALPAFVTRKLEAKSSPQEVEKARLRMAALLLVVTAGGIAAAWGLWRGDQWASWLALAIGAWEIGRFLLWIPSNPHGPVGWVATAHGIATPALAGAMILVLRNPPWRAPQDAKQP